MFPGSTSLRLRAKGVPSLQSTFLPPRPAGHLDMRRADPLCRPPGCSSFLGAAQPVALSLRTRQSIHPVVPREPQPGPRFRGQKLAWGSRWVLARVEPVSMAFHEPHLHAHQAPPSERPLLQDQTLGLAVQRTAPSLLPAPPAVPGWGASSPSPPSWPRSARLGAPPASEGCALAGLAGAGH